MVFNYTPKPVVRAHRDEKKALSFCEEESHNPLRLRQTLKDIQEDIKFISSMQHKKVSFLHEYKKFESMKSFFKLYQAYDRLYHQNTQNITKEELRVNSKLMHLIGSNLRDVFEVSYYIADPHNITNRNEEHNEIQSSQTANPL